MSDTVDFKIFTEGFLLQASLILALGAQNIFVINSGLRQHHHLLVAFICAACDTLLIFLGVLGVATFFVKIPILKISLGILGVVFLFYYGLLKLKEAKNKVDFTNNTKNTKSAWKTTLATLGFSLLNPHVYLDTVILIGGYSTKFSEMNERFYFGAGASFFSTVWFFSISTLASYGKKMLHKAHLMRRISLISGIILITLALKLGLEIAEWIQNYR